ncbi:hypothetical protein Ddye_018070 [Dipteronia dyeriana]|uniref:Protein kinase domain-containing protein n=1 Tax=Dipteronia dyeriana TaxID=168575 RepID=A0AAD9X143_9ROSI|nr:hypothetical protein Ddye_018070 [Dipteronia dyeriana]
MKKLTKTTKTTKSAILKRRGYSYLKQYWQKKFRNSSFLECKRFLGRGSFGSVYFVRRKPSKNDGFPEEMAVKTAKMSKASTLRYEKRLFSILKSSPYVIRCYGDQETEEDVGGYSFGAFNKGEKIYKLFLEFCSGGSLNDYIKKSVNGCFHANEGIVHCDIKPDNILLVPRNDHGFTAKIADFGLSKDLFLESEESPDIRGSYRYMSPEIIMEGLQTFSADIWALGCVVVEMMSGEPAWGYGLGRKKLLKRIGYTSEVPEIPNNISEDAKDFVSKCLNRCSIFRCRALDLLEHPFISEED